MTLAPSLPLWTPEPLPPTVTVEEALGRVLDDHVLAVVGPDDRLVGVATEAALLGADHPDAPVADVLGPVPVTIGPDAHVFEATKLLVQHDLPAIPVVDEDRHYLGFARRHDIFERFAAMLATQEAGAVVSVEVPTRDYALSQLVYAAEQNGVRVRSVVTEAPAPVGADEDEAPAADGLRITLKLDTNDSARVRALFEHYGYRVLAAYGEREDDEDLEDRVRAFLRYLDV